MSLQRKARCDRCGKDMRHSMLAFCYNPGCGDDMDNPVRCRNRKSHQNICEDCVLEDVQKTRPAAAARDLQDSKPSDAGNARYAAYGQGDGRLMDEITGTAAGIAIFTVLGIITGIILAAISASGLSR